MAERVAREGLTSPILATSWPAVDYLRASIRGAQ
jgi:hypothetical protein